MNFSDLGLGDEVLKAVADAGYTEPTPIQAQAIPIILMNRDVLGCAQTGTGKTASFTLPMIEILSQGRAKARMPRTLILEPTRELAAQVAENFDIYGKYHKLNKALLIGGSSMEDQIRVLDRGADVLIATPGRLMDMFERGRLLLTDVKILVIDEADRMLDMGFIPDVEKIVSLLPPLRQTLFFSATMQPAIKKLADAFLHNPKEITVSKPATTAETITQGLVVVAHGDGKRLGGGAKEKREALRALIAKEDVKNALVFCNRKKDVDIVYKSLKKYGYNAGQLHGDMSQPARTETLEQFKNDEIIFLVCSDVAARGLDINNLSHVFNFDVPNNADDYVHRIGRTGRAGKQGHAYTICVPEDAKYVEQVEKLIGQPIPILELPEIETSKLGASSPRGRGRNDARSDKPARGGRSKNSDETKSPEETPKKRQTRSRAKPQSESSDNNRKSETKKPETKKPETKEPETKKPDNNRSGNNKGRQDNDKPVVGMGDHVPAFLFNGQDD